MNKNKIIGFVIFLFLLLLAGYYFISNYDLKTVNLVTQIEESKDQELGEISMTDGVKKISFKYKNTLEKSIILNNLYTSCMCTKAKLIVGDQQSVFAGMKGHKSGLKPIDPNMILDPGEVVEIFVEFDPNAHGPEAVGPMTRTVYLGIDGQEQPLKFNFSGDVVK